MLRKNRPLVVGLALTFSLLAAASAFAEESDPHYHPLCEGSSPAKKCITATIKWKAPSFFSIDRVSAKIENNCQVTLQDGRTVTASTDSIYASNIPGNDWEYRAWRFPAGCEYKLHGRIDWGSWKKDVIYTYTVDANSHAAAVGFLHTKDWTSY